MIMDVMLPWFPVVVGAGIGGRLIGQSRATWLGIMCALYWVVIVQVTTRTPFWADASLFSALLAGAAAIVGLADWSSRARAGHRKGLENRDDHGLSETACVSHTITQFDGWLESKRNDEDPWASFDEFVRRTLHDVCGATHVRPFRILAEGDVLVPMRMAVGDGEGQSISSRAGIMGHVAMTGNSYYADDASQGDLVRRLANESSMPPQWCFAIRRGGRSIGVVSVGGLSGEDCSRTFLRTIDLLVGQFWGTLAEVCRSRMATDCDHVSGVLTRDSFMTASRQVAASCYRSGEPVALAVLVIEGHRRLLDLHLWDMANEVVRLVGQSMLERVRPDDRLGRFDDSRFVVLLRRVDSALATLIARQLTEMVNDAVSRLLSDRGTGVALRIRCGVAGSGAGEPNVDSLLGQSVALCHAAREKDLSVVSDVELSGVAQEART